MTMKRSIIRLLENTGVLVLDLRKRTGQPSLFLPEYRGAIYVGRDDSAEAVAWRVKAGVRGLRVATVENALEALMTVSSWQCDTGERAVPQSRAKYLTDGSRLRVVK